MIIPQVNGLGAGGGLVAVGGYQGVMELQKVLKRFAKETRNSKIDPQKYDGTMTLGTIIALGNTASYVGNEIHPIVGKAFDLVGLIETIFSPIPYADMVLDIILSPWLIDKVYDVIVGIIRLIPGAGAAAASLNGAIESIKASLATGAEPLAVALGVISLLSAPAPTPKNGLGAFPGLLPISATVSPNLCPPSGTTIGPNPPPGYTWVMPNGNIPGHWERLRAGQTPMPNPDAAGTVVIRDHRGGSCPPPCFILPGTAPPGQGGLIVSSHQWKKGRQIVSADWGPKSFFRGHVAKEDLHPIDYQHWVNTQKMGGELFNVGNGGMAFLTFLGNDNQTTMGASWDPKKEILHIYVVPPPERSSGPFDFASDAWNSVVHGAEDLAHKAEHLAEEIAHAIEAAWNAIKDQVEKVYDVIKKYGCALVNNDILVGVVALGAGLVATPATSAAIMTGVAAGKAACTAIAIGELLYAIYQLLALKYDPPAPVEDKAPQLPTSAANVKAALDAIRAPLVTTAQRVAETVTQCAPAPVIDGRPLLPLSTPSVPLATKPVVYPAGAITAFDPSIRKYRVAIPVGTTLSGEPAVTGAYYEAAQMALVPFDAARQVRLPLVSLNEFHKKINQTPLYKQPLFWVGIGSTLALAGGTIAVTRKRRS